MDYQQAITEIGFIKRLLDNTGKELGQSGRAFILSGLVMFLKDLCMLVLSRFNLSFPQVTMKLIAAATLIIPIITIYLLIRIYYKYVAAKITLTLEKQLWQVWLWVIISELAMRMIGEIYYYYVLLKPLQNLPEYFLSRSVNSPLMAALLLLITGILTNRKFFHRAAVILFIAAICFGWLSTGLNWWYYILRSIMGVLPFFIIGGYFLIQKRKTEASHGSTEPSGSL